MDAAWVPSAKTDEAEPRSLECDTFWSEVQECDMRKGSHKACAAILFEMHRTRLMDMPEV